VPPPHAAFKVTDLLGSRVREFFDAHVPECVSNWLVDRKHAPSSDVFMLPGSEFSALLRVNLAGREPRGTVAASAYDGTLEQLREDLYALVNPATGRRVVRDVRFSRETYDGPLVDHLPDVVVCWQNDAPVEALECPRCGTLRGGLKFHDVTHSMHTDEGLAFIAGPGVAHASAGTVHDIRDMTAAWYALLGERPPAELEGRPIELGRKAPTAVPPGSRPTGPTAEWEHAPVGPAV
jgi:predicted AlkP superfamily phosphohydrolase/phosphomutase